jgi:hypothetical protein
MIGFVLRKTERVEVVDQLAGRQRDLALAPYRLKNESMTSKADNFTKQADAILEIADRRQVVLRLLGAMAFRIHCPNFLQLYEVLGREVSDIDFAGYSSQSKDIAMVFDEAGYMQDTDATHEVAFAGRMIFRPKPQPTPHIDVFLDKLQMSHVIDFRGRLELDYPTLNLADMFLEKMQIVMINEKDLQDTIVLLREHEVCEVAAKDRIDAGYVANVLANDWGFYHTVVTNLAKVDDALKRFEGLGESDRVVVAERIRSILGAIENAPKPTKWKLRARIGTKKKWYNDIEEVKR